MTAVSHTIHRMRLDIQVQEPEQAFTLQQQMRACLEDLLPGKLAALFDRHVPAGEYVYLPAIAVQLDNLPPGEWESAFTQELLHAIEAALLQQLEKARTAADSSEIPSSPDEWAQPVRLSATIRYQQAWLFFLEHGILPWWAQPEQGDGPFEEKVITAIYKAPARFRRYWLEAWRSGAISLQRWLQQCREEMRAVMLEAIAGAPHSARLQELEQELGKQLAITLSPARLLLFRVLYWQAFFTLAAREPAPAAVEWTALLGLEIKAGWRRHMGAALRSQEMRIIDRILPPQPAAEAKTMPPEPNAVTERKASALPQEHLLVQNAGLILLHPFLTPLFESLQWLDEAKEKILEPYTARAAHLLAFMAGEEQAAEYDMLLNKILCGLPPETSIPRDIALTPAEKEEGEALLQAVLQYWKPLQGSSIAALQTAFLQRSGKLSLKEDHWLLQVERQTIDILLEQLPWGTAMIRLPWMQRLLRTEWIV
jgi:hypothetical protein